VTRSFPGKGIYLRSRSWLALQMAKGTAPFRRYDLSVFHHFAPPPSGGGHQFLRALIREWRNSGLRVEVNQISNTTRACLFNSYNFDPNRLRQLRHPGCRMVHRVDGPLSVYRGFDDGTDHAIARYNAEWADATVVQSAFSLRAHERMGLNFREPILIPNAADPAIFFPASRQAKKREWPQQKIRIISTSWSDNPNKGADVYEWLDQHLDFSRYDYTFAGRIGIKLRNILVVPPLPSPQLATLLRQHDLFLTASQHDPCSNAVIEALACGLPVIYRNSGGHPELVGEGGLGFDAPTQIPSMLETVVEHYDAIRAKLPAYDIRQIADAYYRVLFPN